MNSSSRNKTAGFTLLEVLITMAILAFISLGIFQTTTSSFKLREELREESDFFTAIRLAMGLLEHDISMIYSPTLLLPDDVIAKATGRGSSDGTGGAQSTPPGRGGSQIDESQISAAVAADLAQSFTFWSAAADKTGIRPSRFVGSDSKMTFIAATHFRIYKDAPESEFAKVTYDVEPDSGPAINGFKVDGSNMLVKQTSANVFENDDLRDRDSTHKYTLLRGLTSCKFAYYRWEDNAFKKFTSWDSDKEDFKWQIPDMIEVSYEARGPGGLSYTGQYQFKPEMPFHGLNPSF